jgi:trimeric autotransporter adhesin
MKKNFLLLLLVPVSFTVFSQNVGIGTAAPHSSAQLDITNTAKGILIPRMGTAAVTSIPNPAKGLLVYDSVQNRLMVNMGSESSPNWQLIPGSGWALTGNSGTNSLNNFIGTTDFAPLVLKVANVKAGFIDSSGTNTSLGFRSLDVTSGSQNSAFGYSALRFNTTGSFNTANGYSALLANTTGSNNTATGANALQTNTTGTSNTATGVNALINNITGGSNTATGASALQVNTNGNGNTANGVVALQSNSSGNNNTATGISALRFNSSGSSNTANGSGSLQNNTTGNSNTAQGVDALFLNSSGADNTATGRNALFNNSIGSQNVATGINALGNNTSGSQNVATGSGALIANTTGANNTGIGMLSLAATTASQFNTAVGFSAGNSFNMGFNNTIIGANSDVNAADLFNCVALGQSTICTASSQARIGNTATNSIGGFADWTNFSDGRYKKNIQEDVKGLDFIMKLRPVTYRLDITGISKKLNEYNDSEINAAMRSAVVEKEKMIQSGFIAQDVEQAARETGYNFSGVDKPKNENDFYGLRYAEFVMPLVKAIQEQQQVIEELKKRITVLEKK